MTDTNSSTNNDICDCGFDITIDTININCNYKLNLNCDTCVICRNLLTDKCCECNEKSNNINCYSVYGKCEHVYHFHCITTWQKTKKNCPICNNIFVIKQK